MKHTNSQRTSSGRFGTADGPKARRIEVWLQPTTVELLDTLVEQWGVGRGKVIDQLITRGPVAPAAWAATQAEPTPSAPPEPAPAPTPAPTPSPTPQPTPSGQFDFSPFCSPTPEPSDEEKAEQRRKHLQEMKLLQGRLDAIKSTDSTILDAIEDLCSKAEFSEKTALEFLLERWSDYHLKPRKRVNKGLWSDLQSLLPHFQAPQNLLFWAVVLRLPELNTEEMPTTSDRFLDWCSYNLFVEHRAMAFANAYQNFADLIDGRMTEEMARKALQLPEGVELTKKAIQDAYKTLAKQHHPDAGGDAGTFQRITEAKDRLLLTV